MCVGWSVVQAGTGSWKDRGEKCLRKCLGGHQGAEIFVENTGGPGLGECGLTTVD